MDRLSVWGGVNGFVGEPREGQEASGPRLQVTPGQSANHNQRRQQTERGVGSGSFPIAGGESLNHNGADEDNPRSHHPDLSRLDGIRTGPKRCPPACKLDRTHS
jgi:hypothetical protein